MTTGHRTVSGPFFVCANTARRLNSGPQKGPTFKHRTVLALPQGQLKTGPDVVRNRVVVRARGLPPPYSFRQKLVLFPTLRRHHSRVTSVVVCGEVQQLDGDFG
jgi:hypothetical protein